MKNQRNIIRCIIFIFSSILLLGCNRKSLSPSEFRLSDISGERPLRQMYARDYKIDETTITSKFFLFKTETIIHEEELSKSSLTFAWMGYDSCFVISTIADWEKKIRIKTVSDSLTMPTIQFIWTFPDDNIPYKAGDESELFEKRLGLFKTCRAIVIKCSERDWPQDVNVPMLK